MVEHGTHGDVLHWIRLGKQAAGYTAQGDPELERTRLAQLAADAVQAESWEMDRLSFVPHVSRNSHQACEDEPQGPGCSAERSAADHARSDLRQFMASTNGTGVRVGTVKTLIDHEHAEQPIVPCMVYRLVWLSLSAPGTMDRIQFKRSSSPFTTRDRYVISALLESLVESPRSSIEGETLDSSTSLAVDSEYEAIRESLPKRQRQVLSHLMRGLSQKEIAKELGISPHTVNDYTKALYRRFDVSGRAELLALFISEPVALTA